MDHLYPVALQLGSTNTVTAVGKFDPWPPKVWIDAPGIVFTPETNSGKFSVEIATNALVGPGLVRVFNDQGASGPRFLVVTSEPQIAELEPNDDFKKPQGVDQFPASFNGRLDKSGDVDSFAVALEAGQTLIASLEAYTLSSPLDTLLRVVDSRGVQVALNHDDGRTLDPFLVWTATDPGAYVLQVFGFAYPANSDVKFAGGNACVYRLHLSRGQYLHYTLPLGVQRGTHTTLRLVGWNLASSLGREFDFDGSSLAVNSARTSLRIPGFDNEITLPVGDGPELVEKEPNNSAGDATPLDAPGAVTGCIDKLGDQDQFTFAAKKGEKLLLEIQSATLGFPLDARLRIEDAKGKELAKSDDGATADPRIEWSAPEDGGYQVVVSSVLHRGGPDHIYRLNIRTMLPALKATLAGNAFNIGPGKTNEIKVKIARLHGFTNQLSVTVKDLPDGIACSPVEIPEKGGEVTLKLIAAAEAKPFNGAMQVVITETESWKNHLVVAELVNTTINNGVPNGYHTLLIPETDQLWLTVLPAPAPKSAVETKSSGR